MGFFMPFVITLGPIIHAHPFSDRSFGADTHSVSADKSTHVQAWAALAPLIAGSPFMRFANREGKYPAPRSAPYRITKTLPSRAAAVMVHGSDGSVATLCLDLDTSRALQGVVDSDAAAISELLTSCGLRFVADHSPSGGRHIYVPLADRLKAEDARELVEALATRFVSLDAGPHRSVTSGCIRPPGSWHKSMTGHQVLDTPLTEAYDVMRRRNHASAVEALRRALAASLHQLRSARKARNTSLTAVPALNQERQDTKTSRTTSDALALKRSALKQVARTGIYDTSRYRSASEARLGVLTHLANSTITLPEIQRRFTTDLAGLAALYGTGSKADRLLHTEWTKAQTRVAENPAPGARGKSSSLNSDTGPALTHSGGTQPARSDASVMAEINDLENVLYAVLDQRLARTGREGITLRMLLRAVIGFARTKKSLVIDVGCRSFALEMGRHHSTIARMLPRLEKLTEGLVERIERARGKKADTYLLTLPRQWRETADALSWRKGKIYGVRPVFWALGDVAALVYEAIERSRTSPTAAEIVRSTGIGRTAVDQALTTMAEMSMIQRRHGAWELLYATSLTQIAEWLGVRDEYEYRKRRIRDERRKWHARLERFQEPAIYPEDMYDPEKEEWDPGDPTVDDDESAARRRLPAA